MMRLERAFLSPSRCPIHPRLLTPNCSIQWPLQRSTIAHLATTGTFPSAHYSHDHLNAQIPVPIPPTLASSWTTKFLNLDAVLKEKGDEVQYVIADGFLMLVDMESVKHFDVRLFVREDYATLKQRRVERHGYVSSG